MRQTLEKVFKKFFDWDPRKLQRHQPVNPILFSLNANYKAAFERDFLVYTKGLQQRSSAPAKAWRNSPPSPTSQIRMHRSRS